MSGFFRLIQNFLGTGPKPVPAGVQAALAPVEVATSVPLFNGEPIPAYPQRGHAVPAAPPEMLVASQRELIDKLHQVSSFSHGDFNAYVLPVIRNFAAEVHLLPASESHHHYGQGGMFRHGLEVAFNAARACEGKIFAYDHWASERERLAPRWRMCALIGGLLHDVGKSVIDVGAIDETGTKIWVTHECSLWEWLQKNNLKHYYITWKSGPRHKRHEAITPLMVYRIIPPETLAWLSVAGSEPFDAMTFALIHDQDTNNPLTPILIKADSLSVERDIKNSRERLAASGMGGQRSLASRLIRAMHDQIQSGAWRLNDVGSPVWITTEGVFGLYPAIIDASVAVLRAEGDKSLPQEASTYLDVLSDFGVLQDNISSSGNVYHTWNLRIHAINRGKQVQIDQKAIRFARTDLLPNAMILPATVNVDLLDEKRQPIRQGTVVPPPSASPVGMPAEEGSQSSPQANAAPAPESTRRSHSAPRDLAPSMNDALVFGTEDVLNPLLVSDDTDTPDLLAALDDDGDDGAPVVRDRANEPDVRDAQIRQSYEVMKAAFPPTSTKDAIEWFRSQGAEGAYLLEIGKRLAMSELEEGSDVVDYRDQIYLRFPKAVENLGAEPATIRDQLEAKQWTERDHRSPMRKTVELTISGKAIPCLRLTQVMSSVFELIMPAKNPDGSIQEKAKPAKFPRGPQIDAEMNALIKDYETAVPDDSPIIRSACYQFAIQFARKRDRMPVHLTPDELRTVMAQFAKQHRLLVNYVVQHLTRQPNPLLSQQGAAYAYLETYRYEDDLALVNAMSPA